MKTQFFDRQDVANTLNGSTVSTAAELQQLLGTLRNREPFFAELIGDCGFRMLLGIGARASCVQFSPADGSPPYMMAALPGGPNNGAGHVEFLVSNEMTPVPERLCIPYEKMVEVAAHFVESGAKYNGVEWEEV